MDKQIKELQDQLRKEHKDVAKYTQHVLDALDNLINEHRKVVASDAMAGIRPDGCEEHAFYTTMNDVKFTIMSELRKTVDDFMHLGDKYHTKHYPDGVKE
ncbi:hypothetical protein [Bacillus sp. B1-b2]|uniref:hypothetical protein n=1 Tax=Bacillus sp. B1-b2 TaxID=2653201 RepID=UPI0012623883|nr:hypothetical protein [Bacillus sp. B1-b2]KAB7672855.1 hypothetical protein F9279_00040 [Bacillus sp. B1-b2]